MVPALDFGGAFLIPELPEALGRDLATRRGPGLFITRNNLELGSALTTRFSDIDWTLLTKETMRGWGIRRIVASLRERAWTTVVIEDTDSEMRRRSDLYTLLLLLARAKTRWLLRSNPEQVEGGLVSPGTGWPHILTALLDEAWSSLVAIAYGYRLLWQSNRSSRHLAKAPAGNRNIAMIRPQFWFGVQAGGSVSHVRGVASGMRALGFNPHLWTSSRLPGSEAELPQTEIAPSPRPSLFEDAAMVAYNRSVIGRAGDDFQNFLPAVVYQRHDVFSLSGLALARRLGVPLVLEVNASEVWAREAWSRLFLKGLARKMERAAFRHADRLVLISEELVPTVLALGGDRKRIIVNPNGVDVDRFDPDPSTAIAKHNLSVPPDAILCGFIGTFAKWHGVLFLADQIPMLLERDPRLRFVLIGEGDFRPEVESRLRRAGALDRVYFPGLVEPDRVPEYLAACDILLSPHLPFEDGTTFFGSPTKLFEYMAAGRAIVASRLGSMARILTHGETAMLFDPGDGAGFCETVLELARRSDTRRTLGKNARAAALQHYTWTANARRALDGVMSIPENGVT